MGVVQNKGPQGTSRASEDDKGIKRGCEVVWARFRFLLRNTWVIHGVAPTTSAFVSSIQCAASWFSREVSGFLFLGFIAYFGEV